MALQRAHGSIYGPNFGVRLAVKVMQQSFGAMWAPRHAKAVRLARGLPHGEGGVLS